MSAYIELFHDMRERRGRWKHLDALNWLCGYSTPSIISLSDAVNGWFGKFNQGRSNITVPCLVQFVFIVTF